MPAVAFPSHHCLNLLGSCGVTQGLMCYVHCPRDGTHNDTIINIPSYTIILIQTIRYYKYSIPSCQPGIDNPGWWQGYATAKGVAAWGIGGMCNGTAGQPCDGCQVHVGTYAALCAGQGGLQGEVALALADVLTTPGSQQFLGSTCHQNSHQQWDLYNLVYVHYHPLSFLAWFLLVRGLNVLQRFIFPHPQGDWSQ